MFLHGYAKTFTKGQGYGPYLVLNGGSRFALIKAQPVPFNITVDWIIRISRLLTLVIWLIKSFHELCAMMRDTSKVIIPLLDGIKIGEQYRSQDITYRKTRRGRRTARIPVIAMELRSRLKLVLGDLDDNKENRLLVQRDAGRRALAARIEGQPLFSTLRDCDLRWVAIHACEMFFIPTADEIECTELWSNAAEIDERKRRCPTISGSSSP
jgi:hypothetical protein